MKLFLLIASLVSLMLLGVGCSDPVKQANTLEMLQQGKAKGNLVLTTDGRVSVGQSTTFWLGGDGTAVSFTGEIDYTSTEPK